MSEPSHPIRVLIADDQPLVRRGLALILTPDPAFEVVGEAENGEQAVAFAHRLRPDVVVMDIRMPVLDGVRATEELARVLPRCRVLALSTFDMDEYVVGALRAGAYGFLPKDSSPEELIAAVRTVHTGEAAVAPRLLTRLISTYVRSPHRPRTPAPSVVPGELTPREVEVWRLIATGLDNGQISAALDISVSTVKNYITSIFGKLGVRDRAQAVIAAYESGLVEAAVRTAGEEPAAGAGPHDGSTP
ncbi:response regulator transcription factor [Streptomyces flavofungini]|uniref:Response regulator transcription factor n=1 Tax=Streptomyces flavofungini TaxID=68200 RepID=A0ABS0X758_9ACTN|nr:response regulator transcription factor [Streptomyces flavofungini]MBJ3809040.1 response regulator transcription factor [Streptomyces flavofungini]GHC68252.1 DNA-binding response regulator [Streptomyces flavofungini]